MSESPEHAPAVCVGPGVRRPRRDVLIGGNPSRLLRLSPRGVAAFDALRAGDADRAPAALAARLVAAGIAHPMPRPDAAAARATTVVVPVRDRAELVGHLVRQLRREAGEVIVVDDGSLDETSARARAAGARVLRHQRPRGPAAARNSGLRAARGGLIAFCDSDCVVGASGWLAALAGHLSDPEVVLAAPRVRSAPGPGPIATYERRACPLDMGPEPALVRPRGPVPYVPSAALIGRRRELLALGGFDEELAYGEDVDLVWRIVAAGWRVRYEPGVLIEHLPRAGALALARQRFEYGRSAARLEARHPGAAAPFRAPARVVAELALAPWLGPLPALAGAHHGALRLTRSHPVLGYRTALGIGVSARLLAARAAGRALCREWLPVTAAALLASRRARRAAALAAGVALLQRAPVLARAPRAQSRRAVLGALDRAAYSAGVWSGAVELGSFAALRPRLERTGPTREPRHG